MPNRLIRTLSRTAKRDPTGTARLVDMFEARLVALFKAFAKRVEGIPLPEVKRPINEATMSRLDTAGKWALRMLIASSTDDFYKALIKAVEATITDANGRKITDDLSRQFYSSGKSKASAFLKTVGINAGIGIVPEDYEAISVLQTDAFAKLKGVSDATIKEMMKSLTEGILAGEGAGSLSVRLQDAIESIGIVRARMIARTESMYAYNNATLSQYERFGISRVSWLTSNLEGTCDECIANGDHEPYPIDEVPDIPAHPNCRCTILPER